MHLRYLEVRLTIQTWVAIAIFQKEQLDDGSIKAFHTYVSIALYWVRYIPSHHEKIGAIDTSFIRKSGKHTDGLAMFWSGCDRKSKKGLEMSVITIVNIDANTAYGLDAKQHTDLLDC